MVAAVTNVSVATLYVLATVVSMVTKLPLFLGCYIYANVPEAVKKHYSPNLRYQEIL
jgi:hypothetical protein